MKSCPLSADVSLRSINRIICCWAASCLIAVSGEAGTGTNQVSEVETVTFRMEQAQTMLRMHQQQPYTVTREYEFFNGESREPASQVTVRVSFQPPDVKNFTIEKVQGSRQGEKIVRKVLEHEQAAAKDEGSHEISSKNYSFKLLRTDLFQGRPCYVLQLIPKRDEKNTIRGEAWVDTESYLIRHIDGELAKNPSWWVRDVHITLEYGSLAGLWLQTTMHAVAQVRFLGQHVLQAQDIDCFAASDSKTAAVRPRRRVAGLATSVEMGR